LLLKGDVSTKYKFSKIPPNVNLLDTFYVFTNFMDENRGKKDTNWREYPLLLQNQCLSAWLPIRTPPGGHIIYAVSSRELRLQCELARADPIGTSFEKQN